MQVGHFLATRQNTCEYSEGPQCGREGQGGENTCGFLCLERTGGTLAAPMLGGPPISRRTLFSAASGRLGQLLVPWQCSRNNFPILLSPLPGLSQRGQRGEGTCGSDSVSVGDTGAVRRSPRRRAGAVFLSPFLSGFREAGVDVGTVMYILTHCVTAGFLRREGAANERPGFRPIAAWGEVEQQRQGVVPAVD
jgi:hypothetical protein